MGEEEFHLGLQPVADVADGRDHRPVFAGCLIVGVVDERVARYGREMKNGPGNLGQHDAFFEIACSPTSSPPVWAIPSTISELGMIG